MITYGAGTRLSAFCYEPALNPNDHVTLACLLPPPFIHLFVLQKQHFCVSHLGKNDLFSPRPLRMCRWAAGLWDLRNSCSTAAHAPVFPNHPRTRRDSPTCAKMAFGESKLFPVLVSDCIENHLHMHRCADGLCLDPKARQSWLAHLCMRSNDAVGGEEPPVRRTEVLLFFNQK